MASVKRKRISTRSTLNKRPKYEQPETDSSTSSSGEDDFADDSQQEWEALRILRQSGYGSGLKYLIEWKGIDPATGKQWEPTWERASNASEGLRTSWNKEQEGQAHVEKEAAVTDRGTRTRQQNSREASLAGFTQTRAWRHNRTVESSETSESAQAAQVRTENTQSSFEGPSRATTNSVAPTHAGTSPCTGSNAPGSSIDYSEYGLHTEIPESQPSSTQNVADDTAVVSSQTFAWQQTDRASGIIPDTQSSAGDVSYIPVTQEDFELSLYSGYTNDLTKENVVGDPDHLDIESASSLDARTQSPATSIAETVANTTQELHSQHQLQSQQELFEISDTLESSVLSTRSDQTGAQDDSANNSHIVSAPTISNSTTGNYKTQSQTRFIENTTHLDNETFVRPLQHSPQKPEERRGITTGQPEDLEQSLQPNTSLGESEIFFIADTPQISPLTSPVQGDTSRAEEASLRYQIGIVEPSGANETGLLSTECSVLEENAQLPFQSQCPYFFDLRSAAGPIQRAVTEPLAGCSTHQSTGTRLSEGPQILFRGTCTLDGSEESTTIDETSQSPNRQQRHTSPQSKSSRIQTPARFLESVTSRGKEGFVEQDSLITVSPLPLFNEQGTGPPEHNVQAAPCSAFLSTQVNSITSIRATVEEDLSKASRSGSDSRSPCSRHDSSQESPQRQLQQVEHSASPIPLPPSYSLRNIDSNIPPRPVTPTLSPLLSKMVENSAESTAERAARRLQELQAANREANPFTPRKRIRASQASSVLSTNSVADSSLLQPGRVPASPIINISAEGTRSPSTVPDRSPAPPVQTSLRTVAFANAKNQATEPSIENPVAATSKNIDAGPPQENAGSSADASVLGKSEPSPSITTNHETEQMSDADDSNGNNGLNDYDDDESTYNDDLHLEDEEFIVPLFIEGRQRDSYIEYINRKTDLLNTVLGAVASAVDPSPEKTDEVERILAHLRAIETHPDLNYAEAESTTSFESRSVADIQHGARFGIDNSVKFKFLEALLNHLRKQNMHVVLLLDQDDNALFNILRTFVAAAAYNYSMPTKGYQSNGSNDALTLTIVSSTATPIIQPADLIICLDGVQSAAHIRQRDWAVASVKTVPVLHLIISQTVGHIERCLSPDLQRRFRIETILLGLSQLEERNEIGNPVDIDTPSAVEAARLIASWLVPEHEPGDEQQNSKWPLAPIASMNGFLLYDATQASVQSAGSSPEPERTKRPLEADDSDTAKRMRYTPQAPAVPNANAVNELEATRLSDPLPGIATSEEARLATSLEKVTSELIRVQKEHREEQVMWDHQQTEHETRQQLLRKLLTEKTELDRAHEIMIRERDKLRFQLETKTTELRNLREELEAQRSLDLRSTNEKDVEITRLRKELEAAQTERDKALNSVRSTEQTLEYTKEQYRDASNTAGQLQTDLTSLETQNAKLAHQASGEVARLKQMHIDRSMKNLMQQNKTLTSENAHLKLMLRQKEEELVRTKNVSGRAAYGTRGQSTTPQPKTRSRAASPERGSRAPRGGGRISNLVAEER